MMDEEIKVFADARPAAPSYGGEARERARRRLMAEAGRRRTFPLLGGATGARRFLGWQAVGAFAVTVALVGGVTVAVGSQGGPASVAGPASRPESAVVARSGDFPELEPKPGQFLLFESTTMYTSEGDGEIWLYRTNRKMWRPVHGGTSGLLEIEWLEPRPYPGQTVPEVAKEDAEVTSHYEIKGYCPGAPEEVRRDYAYLSTLPADAGEMRAFLYRQPHGDDGDDDAYAFDALNELFRESYMPRAQREAAFEAGRTIPGVTVAQDVEDAAGRKGIALGREQHGLLTQLIFDPETFDFLGERGTVTGTVTPPAPVGSTLALTAQTGVTVVDALPEDVTDVNPDGSCDPAGGTREPVG
ncbi:hypothetical protein HNP84_008301 [Thermocatellispora tengchongensis]|uniref:CU044_5270 family protein n=1 Tax=Thermocatellispora tengchongensis TaxID=1073253 RepID=A0A840PNC1_9ACTN|nr:CU044_5270 family protein [Thermocatellispora tengchongensis]MBB5138547.1 hypothetical protein [Thermocatellispora tengchongensis]